MRLLGPHPRFAFGRGRAAQRIRPPTHRVGAFLGGPHRQPGFNFDASGGFGGSRDLLTGGCRTGFCGVFVLGFLGVAQPGLEFGDLLNGLTTPGL